MQNELEKLTSALAKLFDHPAIDDTEQHVHQLVQSYIQKMGFVSREEFDAQSAVLQKGREQLKALEEQLKQLSSDNR